MAAITRLGHYGGPRAPYGSFAGKSQVVVLVEKQGGKKKKGKWEPIQFKYEEKPRPEPEIRLPAPEETEVTYDFPWQSSDTPGQLHPPSTAGQSAGISADQSDALTHAPGGVALQPTQIKGLPETLDDEEQLLLLLLAA